MTTRIRRLQRSWERFGRVDPLWAIVTWPGKKGNKWDPEEFFQTGEAESGARDEAPANSEESAKDPDEKSDYRQIDGADMGP